MFIMEILTGVMIAGFIVFSGKLISSGELGVNNFFSFLAAMMLAYQPIRSLATINMLFYQGGAAADGLQAGAHRQRGNAGVSFAGDFCPTPCNTCAKGAQRRGEGHTQPTSASSQEPPGGSQPTPAGCGSAGHNSVCQGC